MDWARDRLGYVVIGAGVGALADGFVLHQLLQWHHLLSSRKPASTVEGLKDNVVADGVFHLGVLVVVLVGIAMLAGRRVEARPLIGLGLVGWGAFNVVDQIVFHLALDAHHIRMVDEYQVYDWSFFALGVALIAAGLAVARSHDGGARRQRRGAATE